MRTDRNKDRSTDHIADELLVHRCQDGSRSALEVLLKRWQERLWRHAVRLTREPSLADDVLQESLLAIVRRINTLNDPARFSSWAYQIVAFKAVDQIRRRQKNRKVVSKATEETKIHENVPVPDEPVELIRAAMQRLNPKDRLILSLFYLDENNVAEVAEICAIPPGTVKSRLYHARANLKKILETHQNSNPENND